MKKYCVIGNPIEHSLSPKLHNYWIKDNNINAFYEKIKLEENEIEKFISDIRQKKIAGANITVPYKQKIIPFLDKLSFSAEKTQSVNTIILEDNKLIGYNTDIYGFENAIKKINFNIQNKKVFILGAGGGVPSIIFALNKMKVSGIFISNRTKERAQKLKVQFDNLQIVNWGEIPQFDVVINATSLGLKNENINLNFSKVGNKKLFYDVIYNPKQTNFLKEAEKLGNKCENGQFMFVYQALEAFSIWNGIKPKVDYEIIKFLNND